MRWEPGVGGGGRGAGAGGGQGASTSGIPGPAGPSESRALGLSFSLRPTVPYQPHPRGAPRAVGSCRPGQRPPHGAAGSAAGGCWGLAWWAGQGQGQGRRQQGTANCWRGDARHCGGCHVGGLGPRDRAVLGRRTICPLPPWERLADHPRRPMVHCGALGPVKGIFRGHRKLPACWAGPLPCTLRAGRGSHGPICSVWPRRSLSLYGKTGIGLCRRCTAGG